MSTGDVGDPAAGYRLLPPDGWGTEQREGRILLAPTEGGAFVIAIPHAAANPEELAALFQQGWSEPALDLTPIEAPETREDGSVFVWVAGRADGDEVGGVLIALFGQHGGGLILIVGARPGVEPDPATVADGIARTVRFSEPDTAELLEAWLALLRGMKLTYLYSYSSPGPAVEGVTTGGGIQERHEIVLHQDGAFEQEGEFLVTVETGEAGGGATGTVSPASGRWRIYAAAGQAILELKGDSEVKEHVLSRQGSGVYVDGRRYFVTEP